MLDVFGGVAFTGARKFDLSCVGSENDSVLKGTPDKPTNKPK
jgi:hypothetical protein